MTSYTSLRLSIAMNPSKMALCTFLCSASCFADVGTSDIDVGWFLPHADINAFHHGFNLLHGTHLVEFVNAFVDDFRHGFVPIYWVGELFLHPRCNVCCWILARPDGLCRSIHPHGVHGWFHVGQGFFNRCR